MRLNVASDALAPSLGLAADLMAVAEALHSQYALRRSLSEPQASAEQLEHLVAALLGPVVSLAAADLIRVAVGQQWDSADALSAAVRDQAIRLAWRATIEDAQLEVARLGVLNLMLTARSNVALATAVGDPTRPLDEREALVAAVIGEAHPLVALCAHSAVYDDRANFAGNLDHYLDELARLGNRLRARVTTAIAMTPAQTDRMTTQLTRIYGRRIDVEALVDERVIGGVRVDIGGDVIDGSLKARLETARQALTSVPVRGPQGQ